MNTSGKHTPSELLAKFSAEILYNVAFRKTEEKNKFSACDLFSSVSAVLPFHNTSLLMPFFTFNDILTYEKRNWDQFCIFQQYFFHAVFIIFSLQS